MKKTDCTLKLFVFVIAASFLHPIGDSAAQSDRDSSFTIIASLSGGITRSVSENQPTLEGSEYTPGGFGGAFRLVWHPDHLLMVGVETGLFRVSSLTFPTASVNAQAPDAEASINAVPMLLVFAMKKYGVEISSGLGYYLYYVTTQSRGTGLKGGSSNSEIGYMIGLSYTFELWDRFEIGPDLKWHVITERQVRTFLGQVRVGWRLWKY